MVYLAADNNLSLQGYLDIEEMEAAGYDPEVQVVVQAEFSPHHMGEDGITPAEIGLQSWETFRYVIGDDTRVFPGIDGDVTYEGSVDMTNPTNLTEFVQWAQNTYPSERSILVPWNHGGGWMGLIEDETNASDMMALEEFRSALEPLPMIDIVDFDMCNMAGYSTLSALEGQADYVVFSQETVPGIGLPYTEILDAIQGTPTASSEEVAQFLARQYMVTTSELIPEASITKSAYALSGLSPLDAAIGTLGTLLSARLPSWVSGLQEVGLNSQKYTIAPLKDLVSFATLLNASTSDAEVVAATNEVISATTSTSFRVENLWYNGTATLLGGADDVSGSEGLNILFPSGTPADNVNAHGAKSVAQYATAMPNSAWTAFLEDWEELLNLYAVKDLGEGNGLEMYEVWDAVTDDSGADVDFWLMEPDGNVYVPFLGTITPNGVFTPDSHEVDTYYEGWNSRQTVQTGLYLMFAHQVDASSTLTTYVDVQYRMHPSENLQSLYSVGTYPTLNQTVRIEDDTSSDALAVLQKAINGDYSNFKQVSYWIVEASSGAAGVTMTDQAISLSRPTSTPANVDLAEKIIRNPTFDPEGMARLLQLSKDREVDRGQRGGIDLLNKQRPTPSLSGTLRPPPPTPPLRRDRN